MKHRFAALFLLVLCLASTGARAQTCSYNVSDVNFSTVNLLAGGVVDSSATLNVSCSNLLSISLAVRVCPNINAGSGGVSGGTRLMLNGGASLRYQLYQDSARTIPWGSVTDPTLGSPPAIDMLLLPLTSTSTSRTIYGRILSGQGAAPGGAYLSMFSGGQTRFNFANYLLFAPACSTVTQNAQQVPFNVRAIVDRTCTVSADTVSFGARGILNSNIDALGAVRVTCTQNLPYNIALNGGMSNTPPTQRKMTMGNQAVVYGLYRNAARTMPWGDNPGQSVPGTGTGLEQTIPVYGRVAAQTTPLPGMYKDTVVVTITY